MIPEKLETVYGVSTSLLANPIDNALRVYVMCANGTREEAKELTSEILKRYNIHDELVVALDKLIFEIKNMPDDYPLTTGVGLSLRFAKNILNKL